MTGKILGLLLVAQLAGATPAAADAAASDAPQNAEALFEQGLAEMQRGELSLGCPHLAESYRLDPMPGALFTLAECEAKWNRLATALEHYQSFLSALTSLPATRRDTFEERRRIAAGQVTVLSVSAPELTVNVAPELASGMIVRNDGSVIPPAAYGVARHIDPGRYRLTAERAGKRVWEREIELQPGNQATLQVELPKPLTTPLATASLAGPSADPQNRHDKSLPAVAFVAGGVAVAGLTTGIAAGLLAYGKLPTINRHCPARTCDATGRSALNSARAEARFSTVGFSFGIAGLAVAAIVLLWPSHETQTSAGPAAPAKRAWSIAGDAHGLHVEGGF